MLLLTCIPHHMSFWLYVTQAVPRPTTQQSTVKLHPLPKHGGGVQQSNPSLEYYTRAQQAHGIKDIKPTACIFQQLKVAAAHNNRC